jgi:predicted small metal-binding protein
MNASSSGLRACDILDRVMGGKILAKTVGCTDFDQDCPFRITADDGQEDMMVDVATSHALEYHPDFAPDEETFRAAIRSEIKNLMAQAHMSPAEAAEILDQS